MQKGLHFVPTQSECVGMSIVSVAAPSHGRVSDPADAVQSLTFEELVKGYLTDYELQGYRAIRSARNRLAHLTSQFGGLVSTAITSAAIRDYQRTRRQAGAATATINRETSALARMFRIAIRHGHLTTMPVFPQRLQESPPRQGFFEHAEYLRVRAHLPSAYQDILDFAYYSGWRRREITELTWEEIDQAGDVIRLSPARSKTKTGRLLPISAPLALVLQRRRRLRRGQDARVFHHAGVTERVWRRAWRQACVLASVPHRRPESDSSGRA